MSLIIWNHFNSCELITLLNVEPWTNIIYEIGFQWTFIGVVIHFTINPLSFKVQIFWENSHLFWRCIEMSKQSGRLFNILVPFLEYLDFIVYFCLSDLSNTLLPLFHSLILIMNNVSYPTHWFKMPDLIWRLVLTSDCWKQVNCA